MTSPADRWSALFQASADGGPPIRVGIAIDGDLTVTRAEASILDDIVAAAIADIVLVVAPETRRWRRASLGWRLYRALDRRRSTVADDPDVRSPIGPFISAGPIVRGADADAALATSAVDVLLDMTRSGVANRYADLTRHGTWRFDTSVSLRSRLVRMALMRRTASGRPAELLGEGIFANDPVAIAQSRATAVFGTTHLVIQHLVRLHRREPADLADVRERVGHQSERRAWDGPAHLPTTGDVVRWIVPVLIGRSVGRLRRRVLRLDEIPLWRIAIRARPARSSIMVDPDMTGFRWLESPRGHLYADPFLLDRDERTWLFFEDYAFDEGRAAIAVAEVGTGALGRPVRIIEAAGHLSYPYVFEADGELYLVPESSSLGVVSLYRATTFPDAWAKVADLFDGPALDTSVWRGDDQWWFFTTVREPRGGASMLLLFGADRLTGPWRHHPMSPISIDIRDARGAGRIIRDGSRIIRPSQDGSRAYGYSFGFNEIVELTPSTYVERPIATVGPGWQRGLTATHTFARSDRLEAVDGRIERARRDVV